MMLFHSKDMLVSTMTFGRLTLRSKGTEHATTNRRWTGLENENHKAVTAYTALMTAQCLNAIITSHIYTSANQLWCRLQTQEDQKAYQQAKKSSNTLQDMLENKIWLNWAFLTPCVINFGKGIFSIK